MFDTMLNYQGVVSLFTGWTSLNPKYVDVNYTGSRVPRVPIPVQLAHVDPQISSW